MGIHCWCCYTAAAADVVAGAADVAEGGGADADLAAHDDAADAAGATDGNAAWGVHVCRMFGATRFN